MLQPALRLEQNRIAVMLEKYMELASAENIQDNSLKREISANQLLQLISRWMALLIKYKKR
jgi:hypothetical protein